MNRMTPHRIVFALAVCAALGAVPASAQGLLPPGASVLTAPLPPSPPPPKIEVPVVPKMDDLPRSSYVPPPRSSFSDRITNCLQDGAAAGLGPNDRATYSRACANR